MLRTNVSSTSSSGCSGKSTQEITHSAVSAAAAAAAAAPQPAVEPTSSVPPFRAAATPPIKTATSAAASATTAPEAEESALDSADGAFLAIVAGRSGPRGVSEAMFERRSKVEAASAPLPPVPVRSPRSKGQDAGACGKGGWGDERAPPRPTHTTGAAAPSAPHGDVALGEGSNALAPPFPGHQGEPTWAGGNDAAYVGSSPSPPVCVRKAPDAWPSSTLTQSPPPAQRPDETTQIARTLEELHERLLSIESNFASRQSDDEEEQDGLCMAKLRAAACNGSSSKYASGSNGALKPTWCPPKQLAPWGAAGPMAAGPSAAASASSAAPCLYSPRGAAAPAPAPQLTHFQRSSSSQETLGVREGSASQRRCSLDLDVAQLQRSSQHAPRASMDLSRPASSIGTPLCHPTLLEGPPRPGPALWTEQSGLSPAHGAGPLQGGAAAAEWGRASSNPPPLTRASAAADLGHYSSSLLLRAVSH